MSNALPTNFSDYSEFNFNIHLYNTRQFSDLHINAVKTVKRSKSLRHNGPRIWNCMSHEIKFEKKKLFLHSQGNLNAMLTSSVICLILLFSLFCFMYIATHITIVLKLLLCCFCSRPTLLNIVSKI